MNADKEVALFTYGTLQLETIQRKHFGRLLKGAADTLLGYKMDWIAIPDPEIIKTLGQANYAALVKSPNPDEEITGMVYTITEAELAAADHYEGEAYRRIEVVLKSGLKAWVYVKAD